MNTQKGNLRVAMLTQRYIPFTGGAEKQLAAILNRLPAFGIDPMVITRRHDDSPRRDVVAGVPVRRIALAGPRPVASLSYSLQTLAILKRFRPQVVHAHELLSPATTALAFKALTGVPVAAKVLRGGSLGDIAALKATASGRLRLPRVLRGVDAFTVISREIDRELAEHGVEATRRIAIPNGVDLDTFVPAHTDEKAKLRARLGLPSGPLALFVGRLEHEKRIDRLVALWPRVRHGLANATLVVAGTGSLEHRLQDTAGPGVTFVGARNDLRDFYAVADVFVLPSEAEGLSNAMLEALAMGLFCVATGVGAAPDLLTGQLGTLVDVDDDDQLVAALNGALAGPPGKGAQAARALISESYSIDATAARLADLYRALASGGLADD